MLKFIYDPQSVSEYCEVSGQAIKDGASAYLPQFLDGKELNKTVMEYLDGVAVYENMRLLKNIYNEFVIYYNRLNITELDCNKMLAMMAYKNLFPRDFADLQLNQGFVYTLFDSKNSV